VTISGTITYDFVPVGSGLNYAATEERPARLISVQFIESGTNSVLASGQTDTAGHYSMSVPAERTGFVRARALSARTGSPSWFFDVLNNVDGDSLYVLDGASLSSGSVNSVRDLRADSGWTVASYANPRAAAPFAILDTIYVAAEYVLASDPALAFPPLDIHWSPDNVASFDANGDPDPSTGEIGTSFYWLSSTLNGIYLLGAEDDDTDEYDRHVILHEFGHYLEDQFGRNDSIGGPHTRGDKLDLRVAYSEGFASAFAALALGDPLFRDTGGTRQSGAFVFSLESPLGSPNPAPGWFSEESVGELVYDLVDTNVDGFDGLNYAFGELWSVVTGQQITTHAQTSIFAFLKAIKGMHPGDQVIIDQMTSAQAISPVADDFGTGETHDAGTLFGDVLPVYDSTLAVNGAAVNICSTDEFSSPQTGSNNKLASRRFLRFSPPAAGTVTIEVRATSIPTGKYADPDLRIHNQQSTFRSDDPPTAECQDVAAGSWSPGLCVEPNPSSPALTVSVGVEEYVLEVYEWTNTNDSDDPDYPPIGRTCFDVTVTQP